MPVFFTRLAHHACSIRSAFNEKVLLLLLGVEISEGFNAVLFVSGGAELKRKSRRSGVGQQWLQVGLSSLLLLLQSFELLGSSLEDSVGGLV